MTDHSFTQRIFSAPLATTIDYYAERLVDNDKALTFLRKNLLSADANLKVGFSDRTLGKQLPSNRNKAGRDVRERLQGVPASSKQPVTKPSAATSPCRW